MKKYIPCAVALLVIQGSLYTPFTHTHNYEQGESDSFQSAVKQTIDAIIITGNATVHEKTILNALPYQVGEVFDPIKTRRAIHNLYALGYFENIRLYGKNVTNDTISLMIEVTEKKILKEVVFCGNSALSDREIFKKIPFDKISYIMPAELTQYAQKIQDMYHEKGYHDTGIETALNDDPTESKATALFTITEGEKTIVKRISFVGNNLISDKELRAVIITHEDWLLGFLDKSGMYHPGKTEADKFKIEEFYQNHGFMNARVVEVQTPVDPETHYMHMVFVIDEGDQYHIGTLEAPGNDVLPEAALLANIPIFPGDVYSREKLTYSMKRLEAIWGDYGYIFAHINPSVQLNKETKTIDVSFYSELGEKVTLRKITIKGNNKTRNKVIRRALSLQEGALITKQQMENSKRNVSALGYFDPVEGVNWKVIKQTPDSADLDLIVKEAKTGHVGAQLSWGGKEANPSSPADGVTMSVEFTEANLFGYGTRIDLSASWAKNDKNAQLHIAHPWLFDKPIIGAFDLYHKRPSYNQLQLIKERSIYERLTGGALTLGYITPPWFSILGNMNINTSLGIDSITYEHEPTINIPSPEYAFIIKNEFSPGEFLWLGLTAEQDTRNHPVHPSRGHKVKFSARGALPILGSNISFFCGDLDAHWYTPLIGERDLVFHLRGFIGDAQPVGNHAIPYGKLFHVGGDSTVRGFGFGDISPKFINDSIGSQKAFYVSAELIFPINPNMTMKGVIFYDGGAGWDNPFVRGCPPGPVINNGFDYRHAVGFGIRILQPMPIRIDWGFKIDPRDNEKAHQVHFGTSFDW
jgi:outer membrane protein insertion porin family